LRLLSAQDACLERTMSRDPDIVRWTLFSPDLSEEGARPRIRRTRQRAEERRAGAATAAVRALTEWAFSSGINRVLLITIPGNVASEAVAQRAGFELRGAEVREQRDTPIRMRRWGRDATVDPSRRPSRPNQDFSP
jgi:dephospho-CoA kinase